MVKASSDPAVQLTAKPISSTESSARTTPKPSASLASTLPAGIGRNRVRVIMASISRSNHILMAPEAPAPTAIQRMATAAINGWIEPGATTSPARPEKTTSDITRGFSRAMKSLTLAPATAPDNFRSDRSRSAFAVMLRLSSATEIPVLTSEEAVQAYPAGRDCQSDDGGKNPRHLFTQWPADASICGNSSQGGKGGVGAPAPFRARPPPTPRHV